ncbi:MAG: PaaI family thioesterase [Candidatus Zixiibacteriota bacterium]
MIQLWKYENCLVCGDKNEIGMNLPFTYDGEVAATEYTAESRFEGYKEVLHGGILTALLDEVMAKAIFGKKILVATVEIKVKFKKPVKTGQKIRLEGRYTGQRGSLLFASSRALLPDGNLAAEAEGKFLRLEAEKRQEWLAGLKL